MTPLLEVEDLKVHFPLKRGILSRTVGHVRAVDGISFNLERGETLGIVGESGCGKTTTGLAVLQLIEPTAGRVRFDGRDMPAEGGAGFKEMRRRIQIVFQDPFSSLNPRMTVRHILGDPMRIHGLYSGRKCEERVAYLLEKVGLSAEQSGRYPHQFSGGQRQRIGIARALALSPELIIGDEPVSALDVSIRAQVINLLVDLQNEFRLSYIIISHDLAVVEHICDRIAVMYLGKIVESACYRDLYATPRHPYTRALLSAVPTHERRNRARKILLHGDVPSPIDPPSGCRFHPRCSLCRPECRVAEPFLIEAAPGHHVACHEQPPPAPCRIPGH